MMRFLILLMPLLSGFAALVYEVLWLKDLKILFGSTAYSAATVLAAFFLGQALGGYVWGRRAGKLRNALRGYGLLEAAIALSALAYWALLEASSRFYVPAYAHLEHSLTLVLAMKLLVSSAVLVVPSFFIGGTLPVLAQHLVTRPDRLGRTGSLLYAVNVLGAVLGTLAAGFLLPPLVGYRVCYLAAVGINLLVACVALGISAVGQAVRPDVEHADASRPDARLESPASGKFGHISPGVLRLLAFGSGFLTLAMEVLWTRMFAQVLENSVYAFSAILATLLAALACGSLLANLLCRLRTPPAAVLLVLLAAGSVAVGAGPRLLWEVTGGMGEIDVAGGWWHYVVAVFLHIAAVVFLPGMLMGTVLPYLLRAAEDVGPVLHLPKTGYGKLELRSAGRILGHLLAVNTAGAIMGSLCAGFVLIEAFGQNVAVLVVAAGYLVLADVLALVTFRSRAVALAPVAAAALGLIALFAFSARLPIVTLSAASGGSLVAVRQGSHATVAVTRHARDDLELRVNNMRVMGGSAFVVEARAYTEIPLLLHPAPRKVFFIGMGTGITAGGALDFPIEEAVIAEYVPEVLTAARDYFQKWQNGLLDDPRVRVVPEDGRNYLLCKPQRYDVVIGDLVYPEQASSLFTKEHYQVVASRLEPGGLFAQWVPLFQLTKPEFMIIVRTMLEVFPQVTLWRGDTSVDCPAVALVGSIEPLSVDPERIAASIKTLNRTAEVRHTPRIRREGIPYMYYAGNLRQAERLFAGSPLNTDDRPLIEYLVPVSARRHGPGDVSWFVSLDLLSFYDEVFAAVPPERDPLLKQLGTTEMDCIFGGLRRYTQEVQRWERWKTDRAQPQGR